MWYVQNVSWRIIDDGYQLEPLLAQKLSNGELPLAI